tara:strand:+ start:153 stop:836 length:684 start_codon:yes stop_codon:yes gene_type:complete
MPKDIKNNETGNAVAVAESTRTVVISNEDVTGDFERSDILIPTIRLVQKTGELAELHAPGSWVLNQEELLSDGSTPLNLTVLNFRKYFSENIPFDGDERPRLAANMKEVLEMGGTTEWQDNTAPSFLPVGEATVLVEGKNEAIFPFEYEGSRYALARWTLRKTQFTRAARKIITEAHLGLKDGLQWGAWELSSATATAGNNKYFVPVLVLAGRHDKKFASWADEKGR